MQWRSGCFDQALLKAQRHETMKGNTNKLVLLLHFVCASVILLFVSLAFVERVSFDAEVHETDEITVDDIRFTWLATSESTQGRYTSVLLVLPKFRGRKFYPELAHVHHNQEEQITVNSGMIRVSLIDKEEVKHIDLSAGETILIPKHIGHVIHNNRTDEEAIIHMRMQPPANFEKRTIVGSKIEKLGREKGFLTFLVNLSCFELELWDGTRPYYINERLLNTIHYTVCYSYSAAKSLRSMIFSTISF